MGASTDITTSLVTYGLVSQANHKKLEEWFDTLFNEVQGGGGGELLSSSVAGRSFTFAPSNTTTLDMFNAVGKALRVLGGRGKSMAIKRF